MSGIWDQGRSKGSELPLAARIVRRFKADTFRIIEEEPERLAEIKGISQRKAMEIADQVNQKKESPAGNDFFAAIRDQYHTCSENI